MQYFPMSVSVIHTDANETSSCEHSDKKMFERVAEAYEYVGAEDVAKVIGDISKDCKKVLAAREVVGDLEDGYLTLVEFQGATELVSELGEPRADGQHFGPAGFTA